MGAADAVEATRSPPQRFSPVAGEVSERGFWPPLRRAEQAFPPRFFLCRAFAADELDSLPGNPTRGPPGPGSAAENGRSRPTSSSEEREAQARASSTRSRSTRASASAPGDPGSLCRGAPPRRWPRAAGRSPGGRACATCPARAARRRGQRRCRSRRARRARSRCAPSRSAGRSAGYRARRSRCGAPTAGHGEPLDAHAQTGTAKTRHVPVRTGLGSTRSGRGPQAEICSATECASGPAGASARQRQESSRSSSSGSVTAPCTRSARTRTPRPARRPGDRS